MALFSILVNTPGRLEVEAQTIAYICQLPANSAPNYKNKESVTFRTAFRLSYYLVSFPLRFGEDYSPTSTHNTH